MKKRHASLLAQLGHGLPVIIGIVLIWRGVWYVADASDLFFFGGSHVITALGGILLGLLLLYLPDQDLKEIERL